MVSVDSAGSLPGARPVRAPRGTDLSCRGWPQEAAMRMLMNNLDPEVAEHPDQLVVYGGSGRAARSWAAYDSIVMTPGNESMMNTPTRLLPRRGCPRRPGRCRPTIPNARHSALAPGGG